MLVAWSTRWIRLPESIPISTGPCPDIPTTPIMFSQLYEERMGTAALQSPNPPAARNVRLRTGGKALCVMRFIVISIQMTTFYETISQNTRKKCSGITFLDEILFL